MPDQCENRCEIAFRARNRPEHRREAYAIHLAISPPGLSDSPSPSAAYLPSEELLKQKLNEWSTAASR
jgi:hypothetical protein